MACCSIVAAARQDLICSGLIEEENNSVRYALVWALSMSPFRLMENGWPIPSAMPALVISGYWSSVATFLRDSPLARRITGFQSGRLTAAALSLLQAATGPLICIKSPRAAPAMKKHYSSLMRTSYQLIGLATGNSFFMMP